MNKQILSRLAAVTALFSVGMANAATVSLSTLNILPANITDVVTIDVSGTDFTPGVSAGNITLTWDPAVLMHNFTIADLTASAATNGFPITFGGTTSLTPGQVDFNFASFAAQSGPALDFFSLDFTAIAGDPGSVVQSALGPAAAGDWQDGTAAISGIAFDSISIEVSAIPVPASIWLFGSGLFGMIGIARRKLVASTAES
ncbi:MAG: hypothetical protein V3W04_14595 [Gammaproteobacteria bacterium]